MANPVIVTLPDGNEIDLGVDPSPALREQVKTKIRERFPALATPVEPSAPGAAGGAMAGSLLAGTPEPAAAPGPGPVSSLVASVVPGPGSREGGQALGELASVDPAAAATEAGKGALIGGAATAATMLIPGGMEARIGLRALRAAARTIFAGGAGEAARRAIDQGGVPTIDLNDPADRAHAIGGFLSAAIPQLGAELVAPALFHRREALDLRDQIETPAQRLERAQANRANAEAAMRGGGVAATAQGISEAATLAEHEVAASPIVGSTPWQGPASPSMPQRLSPTPTDPFSLGAHLKEIARSVIESRVSAKGRQLYGRALELGDRLTTPVDATPFAAKWQDAYDTLTTQSRELGRTFDPKLQRRLKDLIGKSQEDTGLVDANNGPIRQTKQTLSYGELDEMRQLLQPYTSAYERKPVRRTQEQGAIDGLMADIRSTMRDMRSGHIELERAAQKADDFYVYKVKPVRDVVNMITSNPQPSMIATALLADGAPDRLFTAIQNSPPATANKIRAAAWEHGLAQARDEAGHYDGRALLAWWDNLNPRVQHAITGGANRNAMRETIDAIRTTTQRGAELAGSRGALDARMTKLANDLNVAEQRLLTAQQGAIKSEVSHLESTTGTAGLGFAIANILSGNVVIGAAEAIGAGSILGRRVFARMLANPVTSKLFDKASKTRPGTRAAIRLGAQIVSATAYDLLDSAVDAHDADGGGGAVVPPELQPTPSPAPSMPRPASATR